MRHSIFKQLKEIKHAINGYPEFVYSRKNYLDLNEIPVFLYHSIDPEVFESHLFYLKENNYRTLAINDFYKILQNKSEQKNERLVLLTIDDARSSVWRYAFPLLKKYQMQATLFVIPGLTEEGSSYRENLEDFWSGKVDLAKINNIDSNDDSLCTWQEIIEMYNSGFVDIESHTLFHREVFTNNKIVDFITPETSDIPYNFSGSPYFSEANLEKKFLISDFYGLPIFDSSPLMLAGPKLNISAAFISKCKEIYNDGSKNHKDWKSVTRNIVSELSSRIKYFSIESHSKLDVLHDLQKAREIIQNKLDINAGNHLCLPWTRGNNETINICKRLGIKSCFWGILENKKINKPGDDPYYISRIKNDFIFRLPGIGRRSFFSIYKYKLQRRLSGEKVF